MQVTAVFLGFHMKIKSKKFHRDSSSISLFVKTLTLKSAGFEISGLELKLWSSRMDNGKVEGRRMMEPQRESLAALLILWLCSALNSLSVLDPVTRGRWFNWRNEPVLVALVVGLSSSLWVLFQSLVRVYFLRMNT